MKRKLDLKILADAVLLKLYHHGAEVGGPLSPEEVRKLFKIAITSTFMREVLEKLKAEGTISDRIHNNTMCFEINTAGIKRIQTALENDSSLIFEILNNGDEWLDQEKPLLRDVFPEIGIIKPSRSDNNFTTYAQFKDSLLVALAIKEEKEGPSYRDLKLLAEEFGLKYSEGWVRKAAYSFRDVGYINEAFSMGGGEDGGLDATLTGEGLEAAEELKQSGNFDNVIPSGTLPSPSIPAADRIVTLDHNKPEYKEAVAAIDSAIEAVRGDNEYGARDPIDKERNLFQLEAGRKLLDAISASIKTVETVLIKTLAYLAGIGVAVSQVVDAIEKVKSLLGL